MSDNIGNVQARETYESACEVDPDGAPVLPESDSGERVDAHTSGVVVGARKGHGARRSPGRWKRCTSAALMLRQSRSMSSVIDLYIITYSLSYPS